VGIEEVKNAGSILVLKVWNLKKKVSKKYYLMNIALALQLT
jgi:hypothetical protein